MSRKNGEILIQTSDCFDADAFVARQDFLCPSVEETSLPTIDFANFSIQLVLCCLSSGPSTEIRIQIVALELFANRTDKTLF